MFFRIERHWKEASGIKISKVHGREEEDDFFDHSREE
jgi:hypothetical protein